MKKVIAIIRASKFEEVKDALAKVGVNFFSYYEVRGFGQEKGEAIVYRGSVYDFGYIARYKIEILLTDDKVDQVIDAISHNARTGVIGDGKIYVENLEKVVRIRTGESGEKSI
jgi:nitrogen regulatory protein PII